MSVDISYMGTKRVLAPIVGGVVASAKDGIFLDAFAGMCSVAEQVGTSRRIWVNDAQIFAANVGAALFSSSDEPPNSVWAADRHHEFYVEHLSRLSKDFAAAIAQEKKLLASDTYEQFSSRKLRLESSLRRISRGLARGADNLFCGSYADTYIGVHQSLEVDAIVFALNRSFCLRLVSEDQRRWLLIALGRTLLRCATSTGHFAQYLKPNAKTFNRHIRQRNRNIWRDWLGSIEELASVGSRDWRRHNRVFNEDCLSLLNGLRRKRIKPSVIYADPPYTDDQYSRFYHLLETLILYDYPEVTGAGRYRTSRFQTSFSHKASAVIAIESLVALSSALGAELILSYPTNGLAYQAGADVLGIMRRHYRSAELVTDILHSHSTFGASTGAVSSVVREQIFRARQ